MTLWQKQRVQISSKQYEECKQLVRLERARSASPAVVIPKRTPTTLRTESCRKMQHDALSVGDDSVKSMNCNGDNCTRLSSGAR
eukprot:SAG11_NODE_3056_length_2724_cov_4.133333_4_plen_84_part_00